MASFKVTWPGDKEPMDLCATAVPLEHIAEFKELADKLVNAARWRSFVCDELPFQAFNCTLLIPGALTPVRQGTMSGAGLAAADTLQAFFLTFGGISALFSIQNALRSKISGANPSPGTHGAVQDAKYDVIQLHLAGVEARAEFVREVKRGITKGLESLQAERSKLKRPDVYEHEVKEPSEKEVEQLEKIEQDIKLHEHALSDMRELRRLCVKEKNSLVEQREKVEGVVKVVGRGWVNGVRDYFCRNSAQMLAKLTSYTVPFTLYSCLYVNYVVVPLIPAKTILDKATGTMVAPRYGPVWVPYTIANAFYGFVIGQTFQLRNLVGTTYGERGFAKAGAYAKRGYEALIESCSANSRASGNPDDHAYARLDEAEGSPGDQVHARRRGKLVGQALIGDRGRRRDANRYRTEKGSPARKDFPACEAEH